MKRYIMVHHSATPDGATTSSWSAIERFHTSYRHNGDIITQAGYYALKAQGASGLVLPWEDIGYHAGVERETGIIAHLGRAWDVDAAACPEAGMNGYALHVCVVGDYDAAAPDDELLRVLVKRVVGPWSRMYGIPVERIVGHRDYNPAKTCPGRLFDLDRVRRLVR